MAEVVTSGFTAQEEDLIFDLAAKLTGTCQQGKFRHQVLLTNITRRMHQVQAKSLRRYLDLAERNDSEFAYLVSALTIHTTSWFRESPHFDLIEKEIVRALTDNPRRKFRVLSAACSTGEEVYTTALILESIRARYPTFEYEVVGSDIDRVSVEKAKKAVYIDYGISQIPRRFHNFLMKGTGKSAGHFTLRSDIRKRCRFGAANLKDLKNNGSDLYDYVLCRNVLIYFNAEDVHTIVSNLLGLLEPRGTLVLGHSEAIEPAKFKVRSLGNACYSPLAQGKTSTQPGSAASEATGPARLLVVDDSATVRNTLVKLLGKQDLDVTTVASADEATRFLQNNQVDIITLDLHMPGISGQSWLRSQREKGMRVPVVILSGASPDEATEVLGALENGAQDYIDKSVLHKSSDEVVERVTALAEQYRTNKANRLKPKSGEKQGSLKIVKPDLILIGASTGGTEALTGLLRRLPANTPPILVTQHITPSFAAPFARRLAQTAGLTLADNTDGQTLKPGHLYMALDDCHVGVVERNGELKLKVSNAGPVNRHRPSVDFLFQSAAPLRSSRIFAMILTGMGADGARGLLELKEKGCMTLAQNEASCVVFGMPREAIKLDAAQFIGAPNDLRAQLDKALLG